MKKFIIEYGETFDECLVTDRVRDIIREGRVSKDNSAYCYVTRYFDGMVIYANKSHDKLDKFKVCKMIIVDKTHLTKDIT